MTRRVIGPFNRVEGDLEVKIDIDDDQVVEAWVTSPLYRGFEQMLVGKDPRDALVYAPRICGICSVSQSVAAATALRKAQGIRMATNGDLVTNLVLACENIADHLTHFYLFFMPDFARDIYSKQSWYEDVVHRFKAVSGSASQQLLPARAQFLHIMGMLAGKWPHSLALQPGGSTHAIDSRDKQRLLSIIYALRQFLETQTFGAPLEQITAMTDAVDLNNYLETGNPAADFRQFLLLSDYLQLQKLGRATDNFMSYGAYEIQGQHQFQQGVWQNGLQELNSAAIFEDISHAWLNGYTQPLHPANGITQPVADKDQAYSWCKAPRLNGEVVEVGALARQLIDGQPLIKSLIQESGGNVRNRVVARLLEVARLLPMMEQWIKDIVPGEAFCFTAETPTTAQGVGMVEAARGSLGHWLDVRDGIIHNYQIVAPTT